MVDVARRWSLQGKMALVTGGIRGIGKAVADELLGLGACVHVFSRSEETLAAVPKTWSEARNNVVGSSADVLSRDAREELNKNVKSIFKSKLDILEECRHPQIANNYPRAEVNERGSAPAERNRTPKEIFYMGILRELNQFAFKSTHPQMGQEAVNSDN